MGYRIGPMIFAACLGLIIGGCGKWTPAFKVEKFLQSRATTEKEAVDDLGPGQEVQDSYTKSMVESHKLPPTAKFLRWSDPNQPGMYYHIVIVDGRIVERDVWDSRKK